ncbi:MAG: phosphoribosylamine--glycine ligase [Coriobacteriales bacterium]|jgi:phosphoribosylamine--glycine ligase|nr:phosphoribosylamine--glycine ligase [Coriobacteriales bacterium]
MKILVLGDGGREDAIRWKLAQSPQVSTVVMSDEAGLDPMDGDAVADYAKAEGVDLVVIGPEAPLAAGVADVLRHQSLKVFGPGAWGAELEASKDRAKQLMDKYEIPTAAYQTFEEAAPALAYLDSQSAPIVVKADGLAAGKGVTVAVSIDEAKSAVAECFEGRFGKAGSRVVIEECLEGQECSILAFFDGKTVSCMPPAQDHKRAYDGDEGPNTGGMGVYSPVPAVSPAIHRQLVETMERACAAISAEGIDYRGVLYGGFMLTPAGPKVLEFNVRFGDPETQVVLPLLESDLAEIMLAVAEQRLDEVTIRWSKQSCLSVVLASGGYPGKYETGKVIDGIVDAEALPGVTIFQAGTKRDAAGQVLTDGGRVLDVTALGPDLKAAQTMAYEAASMISFEGMQCRHDIGWRAIG